MPGVIRRLGAAMCSGGPGEELLVVINLKNRGSFHNRIKSDYDHSGSMPAAFNKAVQRGTSFLT